jgi:Holliday junction resolvasome RuvABC endonuclease subunit
MLYIPKDASSIANIIGIDPGSTNLGMSIIGLDVMTMNVVSVDAFTLKAPKLNGYEYLEEHYIDRIIRLRKLHNELVNLFHQYNPNAIAVESPFINMRRPQAIIALTETFYMIQQAVIDFKYYCPFYSITPSIVKKSVNVYANSSNKEDNRNAIQKIPSIIDNLIPKIQDLDEHAIDAICVAYTQIKTY